MHTTDLWFSWQLLLPFATILLPFSLNVRTWFVAVFQIAVSQTVIDISLELHQKAEVSAYV
jgi:hypothetical protein